MQQIAVMLVDDSSVVRGLLRRVLTAEADIEVVASVSDGLAAVTMLKRQPVDVVVLDIEMPRMDGITALGELLKIDRDLPVIMASTLTQKNAEISLKAMSLGAKDYLPKPSTALGFGSAAEFNRDLVDKVRALGRSRRRPGVAAGAAAAAPARNPAQPPAEAPKRAAISLSGAGLAAVGRPAAVAIGCSTGGPAALVTLFKAVRPVLSQPVFITQHMPPMFTKLLARQISDHSGWDCSEAEDGMPVVGGKAYLAPGNFHMTVAGPRTGARVRLNQEPAVNFCRPSVDPMLHSLTQVYGRDLLVLILTGMGQDGLIGAKAAVAAGGSVVAQDEATSVVWGMPGAVAQAGICTAVLPLDGVAAALSRIAAGPVARAVAGS